MTPPVDFTQTLPWLKQAGQIALRYYQGQIHRQQKNDYSPVTEADTAVEKFLVHKLRQTFDPAQYGLIGEEFGGDWQNKPYVWVIDPIDGTRIFVDGLPQWCISLGLLHHHKEYRGAIYLPVTDELYYTDNNGQPLWGNRPLTGMLQADWDRDSFIGVPSGAHRHFKIEFRRVRAMGSVAAHHVYVARGAAVAALHRHVKLWDLAGAHAILTAAGGRAMYLDGRPFALADLLPPAPQTAPILAGHPAVLEKLIPAIHEITAEDNHPILTNSAPKSKQA